MKRILTNILIILTLVVFGQNNQQQKEVDSLFTVLSTTKADTTKITTLLRISKVYIKFETNNALKYCNQAIELSKQNDNKKYYDCILTQALIHYRLGQNQTAISNFKEIINNSHDYSILKGKANLNIGNIYADLGKYDSCLIFYNNALNIFIKLQEKNSEATVLTNIGTIYSDLADYEKAISYYTKAEYAYKENGNLLGQAALIENIGVIYYFQNDYKKALEYFKASLEIMRKVGRIDKMGNTLTNIASISILLDNKDAAIKYFKEAETIFQTIGDKSGQADVLQNLAQLYLKTDKQEEGIEALNKAIIIFKEIEYPKGEGTCYKALGSYYSEINNLPQSIKHLNKALEILEPLKVKNDLREVYHLLAVVNKKAKNYDISIHYYEKYIAINDTIFNAERNKQITEMQTKYDTEKKEQKLKLKNIQYEKEKIESKKKTIQRNYTLFALALMIILIIIVFRSFRQKQKANHLLNVQKNEIVQKNEVLNQQNEEIRAQRDEIEQQKDIVEAVHFELSQSINYATKLQQSILPEETTLTKYLFEHFVLFKPKDKVSGDFYWWTHIEDCTIIAAADCTGHGVPGAFMSMLGVSFLREIVIKEYITHTGVILRRLRKEIIKSLKQKDEIGEQKDGMDMAIISINHETNTLQFSGANNPLYIITNNELQIVNEANRSFVKEFIGDNTDYRLYEIKPDKMPIAIYEKMDTFTSHEIQLQKGDQLYMFSDGFADQFGGPKDKKFKYKPFKQLLINNCHLSMTEQKTALNKAFINWKGTTEQIDDVVVLGIKI